MTLESLLLNLIWILPLLTVVISLPISRSHSQGIKLLHTSSALINLVINAFLTVRLFMQTQSAGIPLGNKPVLHYVTDLSWFPFLNIRYFVGVDAFSMLLLLLTSITIFTALLASWKVDRQEKEYFALFQILASGVFGVFMSFDLALFMVFYEIEILGMYLLIANWGVHNKDYSGKKLSLTLALGSSMAMVAVIALYFEGGIGSWDIPLLADLRLSESFQMWAFPLAFLGFAISGALFPFHNWFPDGHNSAPAAVSMFAAGIMMKMGVYACLRIAMYLMPEGARFWLPYILYLVIFNIVFAAFIAIRQRDLKYIVAYSSMSHIGLVILGLCAMTMLSVKGAVLQMLSHGFITALFFAIIGMIYERTRTRMVDEMGGLMKIIPFIGVGFVFAGFAALGLPGLSGFVAEVTVFLGSFQNSSAIVRLVTVLGILTITISAVYVLQATNRVFNGPLNERFQDLAPATWPERIILVLLISCLLGMGIFPGWISSFLDTSLTPIFVNIAR